MRILIRIFAYIAVTIIVCGGIAFLVFSLASKAPLRSGGSFAVEYRIDGTAFSADLTYENATGGTEQHSGVRLPFSLKFNAIDGQFLYISAQNHGKTGSISCHILLDGVEQKTATSEGEYVIADCSGKFTH